ncbi:hypothetical protein JXB01_03660, partial [Candidatus Micrarchaeota archaeon]|nr:hypothetical protein [Candidatus Micrarchaeota archaeon]
MTATTFQDMLSGVMPNPSEEFKSFCGILAGFSDKQEHSKSELCNCGHLGEMFLSKLFSDLYASWKKKGQEEDFALFVKNNLNRTLLLKKLEDYLYNHVAIYYQNDVSRGVSAEERAKNLKEGGGYVRSVIEGFCSMFFKSGTISSRLSNSLSLRINQLESPLKITRQETQKPAPPVYEEKRDKLQDFVFLIGISKKEGWEQELENKLGIEGEPNKQTYEKWFLVRLRALIDAPYPINLNNLIIYLKKEAPSWKDNPLYPNFCFIRIKLFEFLLKNPGIKP